VSLNTDHQLYHPPDLCCAPLIQVLLSDMLALVHVLVVISSRAGSNFWSKWLRYLSCWFIL